MPNPFYDTWNTAATTTLGLFYSAFWAFGLGYLVSSMIQVFVTRQRMRESLGGDGPREVLLGSSFGFVSSSCSFAALATTRTLLAKGAGLAPSLAFLLASTNLVIELGIVIAVFLSWQFVVGEYVGGALLILLVWLIVATLWPSDVAEEAREHAREGLDADDGEPVDWREAIRTRAGWRKVANRYVMEWRMVWKDVTVGFTVAGIIAAFVPRGFFEALFVGSGDAAPSFLEVLLQAVVGPLAAFFTFIGSMGNIPLAAVLFENGVTFAGIMAFVFSDLVVFPVLRIQARYYGWRATGWIAGTFLVALVAAAVALHYGFAAADLLPARDETRRLTEREWVAVDTTLFLNLAFLAISTAFLVWKARSSGFGHGKDGLGERVLTGLATTGLLWVLGGALLPLALG